MDLGRDRKLLVFGHRLGRAFGGLALGVIIHGHITASFLPHARALVTGPATKRVSKLKW